jgi:hypothetical protein
MHIKLHLLPQHTCITVRFNSVSEASGKISVSAAITVSVSPGMLDSRIIAARLGVRGGGGVVVLVVLVVVLATGAIAVVAICSPSSKCNITGVPGVLVEFCSRSSATLRSIRLDACSDEGDAAGSSEPNDLARIDSSTVGKM